MEHINQELFMTIVAAILVAKIIAFFGGNVYRVIVGSGYVKASSGESVKPVAFDSATGKSAG